MQVERLARAGYDFVKRVCDAPDVYREITSAARDHGIPVTRQRLEARLGQTL